MATDLTNDIKPKVATEASQRHVCTFNFLPRFLKSESSTTRAIDVHHQLLRLLEKNPTMVVKKFSKMAQLALFKDSLLVDIQTILSGKFLVNFKLF